VLSGQVINNGPQAATVTFATPGGGPELTKKVAARSTTRLSGEAGVSPVTLPTVSVEPGSMLDLTIGTSSAGTNQVGVPVLLPDLYYSSITPAPRARGARLPPARPRKGDRAGTCRTAQAASNL
jgi:hypothetical protein